jgi:hypothetical protein
MKKAIFIIGGETLTADQIAERWPDGAEFEGDLDISGLGLTQIPFKIKSVGGSFNCADNNIESLYGSPKYVGKNFYCSQNKLETLIYGPEEVGGSYFCSLNKLTSLEGAPRTINHTFSCSHNNLQSLRGAPDSVTSDFDCNYNSLESLLGGPRYVGHSYECRANKLLSLEGAPGCLGGDFECHQNRLSSLQGGPETIDGNFYCHENPLTSVKGLPKSYRLIMLPIIWMVYHDAKIPSSLALKRYEESFMKAWPKRKEKPLSEELIREIFIEENIHSLPEPLVAELVLMMSPRLADELLNRLR